MPTKNNILKIVLFSIAGFLFIILLITLPIILLSLPIVNQFKQLNSLAKETYQVAKTQDLIATEEKILKIKDLIKNTNNNYKRLSWLKVFPFMGNYYRDGEHAFIAINNEIDAGLVLIEAIKPQADVLGLKGKGTFSGGTAEDRIIKFVQTLNEVTPKLDQVKSKLELAKQETDKIDANRYPVSFRGKAVRDQVLKFKNITDTAYNTVLDAQPILQVMPNVLGYPEAKRYLVIMQNDGELRPTGGFMTAYAVIKVESGKIIPEKSDDIYSLDKKNTQKVKAPEIIEKYLLSASLKTGIVPYWYLRDMNLSPDFKVSMDTFKKYYDGIKSEPKVDGIIAIDTKVLKDLLTFLGPVDVPEYGKFTMDKDPRCHDIPQVVCEIETIVDTPIPGVKSTRKDVLGPLMRTILSRIFSSPSQLWPRILNLGIKDINEKHVLFYFINDKVQVAAEKLNAAGRIVDSSSDYLHVNDANFGGAKSNLFVRSNAEQKIDIKENNIIEKTLTLTYVNPEPTDNCNLERKSGLCLNGVLRNLFRVYVPKGSKLIEGIGSETAVKTYNELDKTVFEGFFTLRGDGGRSKVVLTYQLPFTYDAKVGYGLLIQKQPGTIDNHYLVNFKDKDKKEEFDLTTDKDLKF